ncbi:MAG: RHS repeat-associated core domain-containing protein [Sedimentisphaerales bacterium]|nr:RHS repeat-associated core domain-containing protein [Sedimentisphaerales bacterium]HOH66847.1 RHS repeat-associated core domain-containing protein [Sedimentisphaerales bacterium]HQA92347.1 RHS repeat-associated core domain-containing protein [Sedimentisphaerales bacterium]
MRKFIYGPGIDEPICLIDGADADETCFYHFDGLGSVVALCDVNNVLVERYAYDVFGRPTIRDVNGVEIGASAVNNPYLFTGRRYDVEAGLYYYRARYYDYATGRFLQPDPLGYSGGLNLYAYVRNNPLRWADPYGLFFDDPRPKFDPVWQVVWDIGQGVRDIYHAGAAAAWTAEAGVSGAIGYGAGQVGHLSSVGTITFAIPVYGGGYSEPRTIDMEFVGTAAEAIDMAVGEYCRDHAQASLEMAQIHMAQSQFPVPQLKGDWVLTSVELRTVSKGSTPAH